MQYIIDNKIVLLTKTAIIREKSDIKTRKI